MIRLKAYAKINLTLDICGVQPGGYHELDTIMQTISVYDEIEIRRAAKLGVVLRCQPDIQGTNIAMTSLERFYSAIEEPPQIQIDISKRIPIESGLAGGSSDAAAVLFGLNELHGRPLHEDTLAEIAAGVGADVPFFLSGGTCRATGIGEKLAPIRSKQDIHYVIAKPETSMSTAEGYGLYDAAPPKAGPDNDAAVQALQRGDIEAFVQHAGNVMEPPVVAVRSDVTQIEELLYEQNALLAQMSGSGTSVFGIFANEHAARHACDKVAPACHFCQYARSVDRGIEIR